MNNTYLTKLDRYDLVDLAFELPILADTSTKAMLAQWHIQCAIEYIQGLPWATIRQRYPKYGHTAPSLWDILTIVSYIYEHFDTSFVGLRALDQVCWHAWFRVINDNDRATFDRIHPQNVRPQA